MSAVRGYIAVVRQGPAAKHGEEIMRLVLIGIMLSLLVGVGGCATGSTAPSGDATSISGDDLRIDVLARIRNELVSQEAMGISVAVDGSVVTLNGTVERPETRARAGGIATGTPGVTEVVNEITTRF